MTVWKAGFAPETRSVTVASTGSATIDVRLRVAITERVDVRSGLARASLDSDQNLSGIRLSGKMLAALPDDPESLLQALRLLAATTGTRLDQVAIYVDGLPLTKRLPPKDIIQSVRINANPFSAEFAEPGASRVEILTRPASQHLHGSGRIDFNDARMNARNVFEPAGARYQTRTYEGYLGGPLVPNHWGFLAYGGRWEQDDNVVVECDADRSGHARATRVAPQRRRADSHNRVFIEERCAAGGEPHGCGRVWKKRAGLAATRDCRAVSIYPNARIRGRKRSRRRACRLTSVFPGGPSTSSTLARSARR